MQRLYKLLVILFLSGFFSCEVVQEPKPIRDVVIGTWKVEEVQIGIGAFDLTTVYRIDDPKFIVNYATYRLTFFEDNTYFKIDEYESEFMGIWEFASEDTKILFDKGIDITDIAVILEYDTDQLVLQFEVEDKKLGNMNRVFYFIPE